MREPQDLEAYVSGLYEHDTNDVARHVLRTVILEQSAALEGALNSVLAMRFAKDQEAADALAEHVFGRLPMAVRIDMLSGILDEEDLRDRWPFLIEVLQRVSKLRNALAHGFLQRIDATLFHPTAFNRGKVKRIPYSSRELAWLAWQSDVATTELRALWAILIPSVDDWFGPEPISQE